MAENFCNNYRFDKSNSEKQVKKSSGNQSVNVGGNSKKQNKFNSKSSYAAKLVSENKEVVL